MSNVTGWSRGLEVSGGGQGVVSHAGLVLLRHLADRTGLTGGLSRALARARGLGADRGRGVSGAAGGGAAVRRGWRRRKEMGSGEKGGEGRAPAGVRAARRFAWAQVAARHGTLP